MKRTNLPVKQQEPIIQDDKVYEATLQQMETTIVRATDMVKKINDRLIPLRDELIKLDVNGIEELVTMFSMNRLRSIDKMLKP